LLLLIMNYISAQYLLEISLVSEGVFITTGTKQSQADRIKTYFE
jgi:hypothetical protein